MTEEKDYLHKLLAEIQGETMPVALIKGLRHNCRPKRIQWISVIHFRG